MAALRAGRVREAHGGWYGMNSYAKERAELIFVLYKLKEIEARQPEVKKFKSFGFVIRWLGRLLTQMAEKDLEAR